MPAEAAATTALGAAGPGVQRRATDPMAPAAAADAVEGAPAGPVHAQDAPADRPEAGAATPQAPPFRAAVEATAPDPFSPVPPAAQNALAPAAPAGTPQTAAAEAPAPAAPAAPPPPSPPVRQVASIAIALALGTGGAPRLTVALEPEELGRVEIRVERGAADGEASRVRVVAERPETLALLQRDARQLDRALQGAGIALAEGGMQFSLAGREQGAAGGGGAEDRGGPPR
ncbi:flagellar hook-length control protein FliK, partial [Craurococcus roseus]|uniref:flagellar hook-length control protein FliK n=1 Tax=Craurococcus roseus TaxID=77585 RepID=UPI0031E15C10